MAREQLRTYIPSMYAKHVRIMYNYSLRTSSIVFVFAVVLKKIRALIKTFTIT